MEMLSPLLALWEAVYSPHNGPVVQSFYAILYVTPEQVVAQIVAFLVIGDVEVIMWRHHNYVAITYSYEDVTEVRWPA